MGYQKASSSFAQLVVTLCTKLALGNGRIELGQLVLLSLAFGAERSGPQLEELTRTLVLSNARRMDTSISLVS